MQNPLAKQRALMSLRAQTAQWLTDYERDLAAPGPRVHAGGRGRRRGLSPGPRREEKPVLELTCYACDKTLVAETEDQLVDLGTEHMAEHGHEPDRAHVLARIRHTNKS